MEDALIRHRIKDILMDQIRMQGGKKRRSKSKTTRGRAYAGSKTAKKKTSRSKSRTCGSKSRKGVKRTSPWIAHVKKYAKEHGITYGEALKKARASYKGGVYAGKRKSSGSKTSRPKSRSKSRIVRRRRTVRKAGALVGGRKRRTRTHKSKRAGARVAGSKRRVMRNKHYKRPHIDAIISEFM